MKVIFKYEILGRGTPVVMPADAKIVHVGQQDDRLMIWAEHICPDENTTALSRIFDVFGTGQSIPDTAEYLGTFFDSPFVWHLYETLENA